MIRSFTMKELEAVSTNGLLRLAKYANIKLDGRWKRETILKKLAEELVEIPSSKEEQEQTNNMSVRVRRILENNS